MHLLDDVWWHMTHYQVYATNVNVDHENNKLNRNVHNTGRSLLYYDNFYKLKQGLI